MVQGVPLAPGLGHPGTKEREQLGGSAELGVRGRGVLPPNTGTHLLPLQAWLPWHPREPWGPHFTLQKGAVGAQQVARQEGGCSPSPCHPLHSTYGFAILARISLGMTERGQVSVQVGRVWGQRTPCGGGEN